MVNKHVGWDISIHPENGVVVEAEYKVLSLGNRTFRVDVDGAASDVTVFLGQMAPGDLGYFAFTLRNAADAMMAEAEKQLIGEAMSS